MESILQVEPHLKLLNCLPALPVATHIWDSTIDTMPAAFCLLNAGVTHLLLILIPSPTVTGAVSSWPPVPCCQLGPDYLQSTLLSISGQNINTLTTIPSYLLVTGSKHSTERRKDEPS